MAKFIELGASIEGKQVLIITRKPVNEGPVNITDVGLCYRFKCKINSRSIIKEELAPKKSINFTCSHLDLGDVLEADTLEIWAKPRIKKFKKEANYSAKHGIQKGLAKEYGCAQIIIPFRWALEKKQQLFKLK